MKLLLLMAITTDGMIARHKSHFPDWTGKADKQMFKRISQAAGLVIMGSKTYASIGKPLPNRLNVVLTRRPEQFQQQPDLWPTSDNPRSLLTALAAKGYEQAILAGGATANSLFLNQHLIDEMILTVVPRIFGQGIPLFTDATDARLALIDTRPLDSGTQVMHYRFLYNPP